METEKKNRAKNKAVALKYDDNTEAPQITASGKGVIAEMIINKAKENGIHIQEDPALVEVLSKIDIGKNIPPELYMAVAEVLAFVYSIDKTFKRFS